MTITIPENLNDITLGQYLSYEELMERNDLDEVNFNKRKVSIFTGIAFKQIAHIKKVDFDRLLTQIDTALNTEAQFTDRFTMNNVEFGFIPDFDKMTIGEYSDLSNYLNNENPPFHKMMAVLFRPIFKRDGNSYAIIPYKGTEEYAEIMKGMPYSTAVGALVFFCHLSNELQKATQKYLTEAILRASPLPSISKRSAGTQLILKWLKGILLRSKKYKK